MKTVHLLLAAGLLSALSGCSTYLYDLGQDRAAERCAQLVTASDRSACLRANGPSYDDYEAKRRSAQQGKAP